MSVSIGFSSRGLAGFLCVVVGWVLLFVTKKIFPLL
jgi:hypothetical protein